MDRAPDGRLLVVADTCVLINFLIANRFHVLCRHKDYRIIITEHTRAEIIDSRQRAELDAAIAAGEIEEIAVTDPRELGLFAASGAILGAGEAAAIAVAANRNWAIATDEGGRTRREIDARIGRGRLLTTPGLLLKAILNGTLTVAEADGIKGVLAANRFVMGFASFADLLPGR